MRWIILRRVTSGDWTAVEGWLEETQAGKKFRTRFTTWLKVRSGQIVHQIDYVDYVSSRRQVAGTEPAPSGTVDTVPASSRSEGDAARAVRVVDEFYRRYEGMQGTWRGLLKNRPFATRFTTWLLVRGEKIARQIDYVDYPTFRRQTSSSK